MVKERMANSTHIAGADPGCYDVTVGSNLLLRRVCVCVWGGGGGVEVSI